MIAEVLSSCSLTLGYLRRLVADVPDTELCRQPGGAVNHPVWVVGHLTVSLQALGGELGVSAWLPGVWEGLFGTGSTPLIDPGIYPSMRELLVAIADAEQRLAVRLDEVGERGLTVPLPDERHRRLFPTVGHAVIHILTSHAAVHVGQVSVWRRAAGFPPPSEIFV